MKSINSKYVYYLTIPIVIILLILVQNNNYILQNEPNHIKKLMKSFREKFNKDVITSTREDNFVNNSTKKNETFRIKSKKYALMSATLDDNYTFNIPVVVHAWRRINIEPIVLIIKDDNQFINKENSSSSEIIKYLNLLNVQTLYIQANRNFSIVISQVIRMFIGIFPDDILLDDDFIMTTDSDLAPLNPSYYNVDMNRTETTITVWNAFCCGSFEHADKKMYRMFPMGHIGMTKKNWRNAIELNKMNYTLDGDSVLKMLLKMYGKDFKQDEAKGGFSWYADQRLISAYVNLYAENNNKTLDLRGYSGIRLDRGNTEAGWNWSLANKDKLTDAHLYQSQSELTIKLFKNFLDKCFFNETNLIDFYREIILKFWR